jgi:hypothetical protein
MESPGTTEREGTTTMATKKITPVNPDTKADDEVEAKDAADRKTGQFEDWPQVGPQDQSKPFFLGTQLS